MKTIFSAEARKKVFISEMNAKNWRKERKRSIFLSIYQKLKKKLRQLSHNVIRLQIGEMKVKKIQNWIAILAMLFLLTQSTIGVIAYVNKEEPSQRMGMMGQPPNTATASTNTDTNTDANSNTTENDNFSADTQNDMMPFNGMEERGGAPMDNNDNTASLIGYIAGIVISLGGLVVTFLNWRKNKQIDIAE